MPVIHCPECGHGGVSSYAKACPHCGYNVWADTTSPPRQDFGKGTTALLLAVLAAVVLWLVPALLCLFVLAMFVDNIVYPGTNKLDELFPRIIGISPLVPVVFWGMVALVTAMKPKSFPFLNRIRLTSGGWAKRTTLLPEEVDTEPVPDSDDDELVTEGPTKPAKEPQDPRGVRWDVIMVACLLLACVFGAATWIGVNHYRRADPVEGWRAGYHLGLEAGNVAGSLGRTPTSGDSLNRPARSALLESDFKNGSAEVREQFVLGFKFGYESGFQDAPKTYPSVTAFPDDYEPPAVQRLANGGPQRPG